MKNISKMTFYCTLIMGTMMTACSNSWMGMWMGLEINLLSIIPLITNQKNKMESEAAMKYFITQAMASTLFLMTIILTLPLDNLISKIQTLAINSAILTKMGAAPFHFWFPEVLEGLNWTNATIMLTWQKVAPMTIMMETNKSMTLMSMIMITSMMVSGIMGINQTQMKKILAYSSINHTGWLIGTMMTNQSTWMIYLTIYFLMTANITFIMKTLNIYSMNQLTNLMNNNKSIKLTFSMNFLSMGGIPPLVGFFPKWIVINQLIDMKMFSTTITMIISTLMTIFFYIRITMNTMIMAQSETTMNKNKISSTSILKMNFTTLSSLILTPMFTMFL